MLLPSLSQCCLGHWAVTAQLSTPLSQYCHYHQCQTSGNCHRCDSVGSSVPVVQVSNTVPPPWDSSCVHVNTKNWTFYPCIMHTSILKLTNYSVQDQRFYVKCKSWFQRQNLWEMSIHLHGSILKLTDTNIAQDKNSAPVLEGFQLLEFSTQLWRSELWQVLWMARHHRRSVLL